MRKLLFVILLFILCPVAFSQLKILSFEAKQHIGDSVRIDGIIVFAEYKAREKTTYVYFSAKPPLQDLTVLIRDTDLHNFPDQIKKMFTNKTSVAVGKIVLLNNKPAIIAHSLNDFAPGPGQ